MNLGLEEVNFAFEAIDFQSPELAEKMTALIDEIRENTNGKQADDSKAAKNLIELLRNSTGLKIQITFDTEYPPCCIPFHINPDTILGYTGLKGYYAESAQETMERLKKIQSTSYIDLKRAKVSGIFSVPEVPIYFNYVFLKGKQFTSRELAAILAHEVGHLFVAMEMAFRTVRTNQVLSAISKASAGGDQGQYNYILKTSEQVMGLKTGVLDQAGETNDPKAAVTITLANVEKNTREQSLMGNTTYDTTTFEAAADNFASRLGLGRDLATGLEKLHRSGLAPEYTPGTRTSLTMLDIMTLGSLVMVGFMATSPFAWFFAGLMVLITNARMSGNEFNNMYDSLDVRFKRIKEQSVIYIKNVKLPAADAKRAIENIEHIEKMIAEVDNYKGFLPALLDMIGPKSRAVLSAREVQQNLESLAANDLYVKAAKIRTM
jgi:hypothetical protein